MKNKFIPILLLLSLVFFKGLTQVNKTKSAIFSVSVAPNDSQPDSIIIRLYKGMINRRSPNMVVVKPKVNIHGNFKFLVPCEQEVTCFDILLYTDNSKHPKKTNIYYASQSDNIRFVLTKGNDTTIEGSRYVSMLSIHGKGSEKYKLSDKLKKIYFDIYENGYRLAEKSFQKRNGKIVDNFWEPNQLNNYLNDVYSNVKLNENRFQDSLFKYKKNIGKNYYDFFSYELNPFETFRYYITWVFQTAQDKNSKKSIIDFYFAKLPRLRPSISNDQWLRYATKYLDFKSLEIMYETYFKTYGKLLPFDAQYSLIKGIENKQLSDILICKLFVDGIWTEFSVNDFKSRDSCLIDALKFIKVPELRNALNHQFLFTKGREVFNFSFLDTSGNILTLKDLKGNVFLMDFYAEGCSGCAVFAKTFENEIYPEFANNSRFKIVSVSADKTKERWLRAINSGKYTQSNSINLNTGAEGLNHPMLKYYQISAIPFLLLVGEDGRLISNLGELSYPKISALIRESLNDIEYQSKISGK
jgi:hypothetical protein